ncbi:MAG: alpha/beta hydrolase [Leptospiraceae bacterium]|nr:MAG: alpha/beta hydrolase [Leptospiraceae bacterium]
MISFFKFILLLILFVYIIYGCFLYYIQENIIFYPVPYNEEEIKYIKNQTKQFDFKKTQIDDKIITYWENKIESNQIIFYFGGNAENTNYTVLELLEYPELLKFKWILINYPGYNGSNGKPSEKSFYEYALSIYQKFFTQQINTNKIIILMGRSIGTGVVTFLASNVRCDKLILITPFDSIENIAKKFYPLYPTSIFLKHKFPSYKYIQNINIPILILSAEKDEIIPRNSTEKLIEYIKNKKLLKYYIIPDTYHNTISEHYLYWQYLKKFILED